MSLRAAPLWAKIGSLLTDLILLVSAYLFFCFSDSAPPVLRSSLLVKSIIAFSALSLTSLAVYGATLGQMVWQMVYAGPRGTAVKGWPAVTLFLGGKTTLCRNERNDGIRVLNGFVCLFGCAAMGSWLFHNAFFNVPYLRKAEIWKLSHFIPAETYKWNTLPFFYVLGAWPKEFDNKPVLLSLPYEKGPPAKFLSEVIFRFQSPEISVAVEGPRTPVQKISAEEVKSCLTEGKDCRKLRAAILERHVVEERTLGASHWNLRWFEVNHPTLPDSEEAHGIYLSSSNGDSIFERFVIINSEGAHQTIRLKRPDNDLGAQAQQLVLQTIGSLRVVDSLEPGRALINSQIADVQLDRLQNAPSISSLLRQYSEIQSYLLAKISVEPKILDTYYHLGGTALMLIRKLDALKKENRGTANADESVMSSEWLAVSRNVLQSAFRYARDIAPDHPNTTRLEQILAESQKY